jgi:hypothetical protein
LQTREKELPEGLHPEAMDIQKPEVVDKEEETLIDEKIKNAKFLALEDCLFCQHKSEDLTRYQSCVHQQM